MSIRVSRENSDLFLSLGAGGHRASFVGCPHCNIQLDHMTWLDPENIKEINLKSEFNKSNTAIVISECPNCFEYSWIHIKLKGLAENLSSNGCGSLAESIREEINERKKKRNDKYEKNICKDCQLLNSMDMSGEHVKRECPYGKGLVVGKCDRFMPKKLKAG